MVDFITAIGLVLVIEGAAWALFPAVMTKAMSRVMAEPPSLLRRAGLIAAFAGVLVVWLARG